MKILLTGDLHLGKSYAKYPEAVSQLLADARLRALENAVAAANREDCDFFVIAGDLYDKASGISKDLHRTVCRLLGEFSGQAVLVLPGNHDYCADAQSPLWRDFEACAAPNTCLCRACQTYPFGRVVFYACPCHDKHAKENALGWLANVPPSDAFNVGIAHGAVEGYSLDKDQIYYPMTPAALLACSMDLWLIGHTHTRFAIENRIFNAGTHQQTDIADGSTGEVYLLNIEEGKKVTARALSTGVIRFVEKNIQADPTRRLQETLHFEEPSPAATFLRVNLSGTVSAEDYQNRASIYSQIAEESRYIRFDVRDSALKAAITPDMIDEKFPEGTVIHKLLHTYENDEDLLNLAYALAEECLAGKVQKGAD